MLRRKPKGSAVTSKMQTIAQSSVVNESAMVDEPSVRVTWDERHPMAWRVIEGVLVGGFSVVLAEIMLRFLGLTGEEEAG